MTNMAPTIDMNGEASGNPVALVSKGGPAVLLGVAATVTDPDSPNFDGGSLTINVSYSQRGDEVVILGQGTGPGEISVSNNTVFYGGVSIGTLVHTTQYMPPPGYFSVAFNANATPAAAQALLQRIGYRVDAASTDSSERFATVTMRDGDGGDSSFGSYNVGTVIRFSGSNAPPTVTTSNTMSSFVEAPENGTPTPVAIDPQIQVSDSDGTTFVSAAVRISSYFVPGQDILDLPMASSYGLSASYDANAGLLTLTATGDPVSHATMRNALASVRYVNIADEPTGTSRVFTITVNDGLATSSGATRYMSILDARDPTIIDLNGTGDGRNVAVSYSEQAAPVAVAPGAVLSDADTSNFGGAQLTVWRSSYGTPDDVIAILNVGNGSGQIGVAGSTLSYGGVVIGSFTGGTGVSPLVVTFNPSAGLPAVQALVRAVSYFNGSDRPSSSAVLDFNFTDGSSARSALSQAVISITQVNDPLTLDLNGAAAGESGALIYTIGSDGVPIAPDARVADVDAPNMAGGSLRITLTGGQVGDVIGILQQGSGPGEIEISSDGGVAYEGLRIGTSYPGQGLVRFNVQYVPIEAVQALVRAIGFANTSSNPSTAVRTLGFELTVPGEQQSFTQTATISIAQAGLRGDEGDNVLIGGDGVDRIFGLGGNDRLDGRGGADEMTGGAGDDTYIVDNAGDLVVELANEGIDTVQSLLSTILGDHVEQLILTGRDNVSGTGNGLDNVLTGNLANNALSGGGGNDRIVSGGGIDDVDGGAGTDTLVLDGGAGSYRVFSVDGADYIFSKGGGAKLTGIELVQFADGTLSLEQLLAGRVTFDPLTYAASHRDLAIAFGTDGAAAGAHFSRSGVAEGRNPLLFEPLRYIASHADLIGTFGTNGEAGRDHYLRFGASEGRATANFDPLAYTASHPDLITAFGTNQQAASEHYIRWGFNEGRITSFDPLRYTASYPDLIAALRTDPDAAGTHFIRFGFNEQRVMTFDALLYGASNTDLAVNIGHDAAALTQHYITFGHDEGRAARGFDAIGYLLASDDLAAAGLGARGALDHWLHFGADEGRGGDALFGREQASHDLGVGETRSDVLSPGGERDWFQVTLGAGQTVTISLGSDAFDPFLKLHDASGKLVAFDADSGDGDDALLTFTASEAGLYYLVVDNGGSALGGDYAIGIMP